MRRTTLGWLGACVIALPATAHAADEDSQFWIYLNTVVPVSENATATLELSPRFREEDTDQLVLRGTLDFELSDAARLGGGAAWVEYAGGHEFRPHQQLTLTAGPLAFRTRVEERFFDGADRMELRLRQRVQLNVPLAERTRAAFSGELFYIARSRTAGGDDRVEQWRLNATLNERLSGHLDAGVGYLFIATPREGAADRISHVAQVVLTWRP